MTRRSAHARGYDTEWEKARVAFLAAHPRCSAPDCTRKAVHVHHSTPHRGDRARFWDRSTWRGRCAEHHNRDDGQRERWGYANRLGADGLPIDPAHPFNRGATDA